MHLPSLLLLMTVMVVVAAANAVPNLKMTVKEWEEDRDKCVQEVQKALGEEPLPKINGITERKWVNHPGKGVKRWKKYKPCLVAANKVNKHCFEDTCKQDEDEDGFVAGGKYDKCIQKCGMKSIVPAMFPEMTLHQMIGNQVKCMREVRIDLGENPIKFTFNALNTWMSEKSGRFEGFKTCVTSKVPAYKYCYKEVCKEDCKDKFDGPCKKCFGKCERKINIKEKM